MFIHSCISHWHFTFKHEGSVRICQTTHDDVCVCYVSAAVFGCTELELRLVNCLRFSS
jgi:hypothetical protein